MSAVDCSDPDACHEWPGVKARGGYGLVSPVERGRPMARVNRVVLEAKLGRSLAAGMYALHSCDNPPCCNERHLYEGTQRRNLADASMRGRLRIGANNPSARLSEADVRAIRADTRPFKLIGAEYGISHRYVEKLKARRTWRHIN